MAWVDSSQVVSLGERRGHGRARPPGPAGEHRERGRRRCRGRRCRHLHCGVAETEPEEAGRALLLEQEGRDVAGLRAPGGGQPPSGEGLADGVGVVGDVVRSAIRPLRSDAAPRAGLTRSTPPNEVGVAAADLCEDERLGGRAGVQLPGSPNVTGDVARRRGRRPRRGSGRRPSHCCPRRARPSPASTLRPKSSKSNWSLCISPPVSSPASQVAAEAPRRASGRPRPATSDEPGQGEGGAGRQGGDAAQGGAVMGSFPLRSGKAVRADPLLSSTA